MGQIGKESLGGLQTFSIFQVSNETEYKKELFSFALSRALIYKNFLPSSSSSTFLEDHSVSSFYELRLTNWEAFCSFPVTFMDCCLFPPHIPPHSVHLVLKSHFAVYFSNFIVLEQEEGARKLFIFVSAGLFWFVVGTSRRSSRHVTWHLQSRNIRSIEMVWDIFDFFERFSA